MLTLIWIGLSHSRNQTVAADDVDYLTYYYPVYGNEMIAVAVAAAFVEIVTLSLIQPLVSSVVSQLEVRLYCVYSVGVIFVQMLQHILDKV